MADFFQRIIVSIQCTKYTAIRADTVSHHYTSAG